MPTSLEEEESKNGMRVLSLSTDASTSLVWLAIMRSLRCESWSPLKDVWRCEGETKRNEEVNFVKKRLSAMQRVEEAKLVPKTVDIATHTHQHHNGTAPCLPAWRDLWIIL